MKKKVVFIALLVLVAMVSSLVFSSCTLVKLNEERQANRVMANVSYEVKVDNAEAKKMLNDIGITDYGMSIDINRRELISSTNYTINRMANAYASLNYTYNYDYETVMGDTLDSLIDSKYYVMKAVEYLLNNSSTERLQAMYMFCRPDEYKAVYGNKLSAEGVLTIAEWYSAVGSINDTLQQMLDGYVEDEEDDLRNDRISAADNKISEYYEKGYFVTGVHVLKEEDVDGDEKKEAYKNVADQGIVVYTDNGERFVSGLYGDNFVLTGKVDSDDSATDAPAASELDHKQIYVGIELTLKKEGGNDVVYVPRPASESTLTISRKTDAEFVGKYVRTRGLSVSYTGRVYEDNDDGYTTQVFNSDEVEYKVAFPRNALEEKAEEVNYLDEESVRYASKTTWLDFLSIFDKEKKELNKDSEKYTAATEEVKKVYDGLADLYAEPFVTTYEGDDKNIKDGYRQLRNTLSSANIGYTETEPAKDSAEYALYKNYSGLYVYYNEQFMSVVLDAVKHEVGLAVSVADDTVAEAYEAKVRQDKVKYDTLGYADQLDKFFSDTTDIAEVYYVPMNALKTQYEIDPKDKSYAPLFNGDGTLKTGMDKYVEKKNDKYYMSYIYENEDGTYTINAFFVGAMLFSFGNDEKINDNVVVSSNVLTDIAGYKAKDLKEEDKVALLKQLAYYLKTAEQITEEGALQEDVKTLDELFKTEDGKLVLTGIQKVMNDIKTEAAGKTHEEILEIFKNAMAKYNDDSGKLSDPGYLITSGNVKDSWAMADFAQGARAIYYGLLAAGEDPNKTDMSDLMFGEGMTYYGLHYMMVTLAPYYHVSLIKVNVDGEECYALAPNTVLNLAGDTQAATIRESLKTAEINANYTKWQVSFTDETIANATTKYDKNYEKLVKDIKEQQK